MFLIEYALNAVNQGVTSLGIKGMPPKKREVCLSLGTGLEIN
jgi:hypothetical protein